MSNDTPYRASAEIKPREAAPKLVVAWTDHEQSNRWRVYMRGYYAVLFSVTVLAVIALLSLPLAVVCGVLLASAAIYQRGKKVAPGCVLEVADGVLAVTPAGAEVGTHAALSAVRDVEIERKSVQRVSFHQSIGDAVPSTALSGDLDVARIVVVLDGDAAPIRLTEEYAPVFVCLEKFGKVRTFLRSHGWKPASERD